MARFYKEYDNSGLKQGEISVNSLNYYSTALGADGAQGASVLSPALLTEYELFSAAQDDSDNDVLTLPKGVPVGTVINIIATGVFEITADGTTKINNTVAPNEIAMAANQLLECTKTLNGWIAILYAIDGAVTSPTPN